LGRQLPDLHQRAVGGRRRPPRDRPRRGDAGRRRGPGRTRERRAPAAPGGGGMSAAAGVLDLLRPDLRGFAGYRSARSEDIDGDAWLNANEAAWASTADRDGRNRRYPPPQPADLCDAMAALYGCRRDQLLVGRGSDEA